MNAISSAIETVVFYACHHVTLLVLQVVLVGALSAVAIYRREISCNHCYAEESTTGSLSKSSAAGTTASKATIPATAVDESSFAAVCYERSTEDLLDGAGLYHSATSLAAAWRYIVRCWDEVSRQDPPLFSIESLLDATDYIGTLLYWHPPMAISIPTAAAVELTEDDHEQEHDHEPGEYYNRITYQLPLDAQLHIFSYLHPRDVATLGSVDHSLHSLVDGDDGEVVNACSMALWKSLWRRDYAWIVEQWDVGRECRSRSAWVEPVYSKQFYFEFALSFVNYVLAGQSTVDSCLIALQGHIYDITAFLMTHPGSPETVLVQAGRDGTRFFEGIRHSSGARRLAKSMCIAVDCSRIDRDSCGIRPTVHTSGVSGVPLSVSQPPIDSTGSASLVCCPQRIYDGYRMQEEKAQTHATQYFTEHALVQEAHVYYDSFQRCWKAWYTDREMQIVHVNVDSDTDADANANANAA
jgi:Cytochrome b5-like Heme/Steroid binding domain